MAKLSIIQGCVELCAYAGVTPMIWGHRGVGKSSLVAQLAERQGYGCVNLRLAQMEASDLRGLPDKVDGRTVFLPPAEFPRGDMTVEEIEKRIAAAPEHEREALRVRLQPRYPRGYLFLDELPRAQHDVLQAVFELVLDRKVGQYVLPAGWSVVCAGNFLEGAYIGSGFNDEAFLDRFAHLTFSSGEPTLGEWVDYMSSQHGDMASEIVEFVTTDLKYLQGEVAGENPFVVQPSHRSWDAVARVMKASDALKTPEGSLAGSPEVRREVIAGLVGRDVALAWEACDMPVKPAQLIQDGVKAHLKALEKLSRNQVVGLTWGLVGRLKSRIKEEAVCDVAIDYLRWVVAHSGQKDMAVAFARSLLDAAGKSAQLAKIGLTNKALAKVFEKNKGLLGDAAPFMRRLQDDPQLRDLVADAAWGK